MRMHIVRKHDDVPGECLGAAVAIGNFDGVHIGHLSVLRWAIEVAGDLGRTAGVITFEPHPRQFFQPNKPAFRLMTRESRARRLQMLGFDVVFEITFDARLANATAEEFSRSILAVRLGISHAIVGADFRFGKARASDASDLSRFGDQFGFGVTVLPLKVDGDTEYSSTAVRKALAAGHVREANSILGHHHRIEGCVIHGEKRGRDLGIPTANLSLDNLFVPAHAVYAVSVDIIDGEHAGNYGGVASIGTRPTFGDSQPVLEVHVFGFDGDLYGTRLSVALLDHLRPETKFDSVDELVAAMHADCERSREVLAAIAVSGSRDQDGKPATGL